MGIVLKRNIGILNDNIQAMMTALANLAFSSARPTLAQLDWTSLTHSVTLVTTGLSHCSASADTKVAHGGNLVITLSPDSGYSLVGVTPSASATNGNVTVNGNVITVSNITADTTVTLSATAVQVDTISLDLSDCTCTTHNDGDAVSGTINVTLEADDGYELTAEGITVTGGTATIDIVAAGAVANIEIVVAGNISIEAVAVAESAHIQNGLIFYLDGRKPGSNANAWTDRIAGLAFTKGSNVTVVSDNNNYPIGFNIGSGEGSAIDKVMALMNNGAVDTATELKYVNDGKLAASGTALDMAAVTVEVAYKSSVVDNKVFVFHFSKDDRDSATITAPYFVQSSNSASVLKGVKGINGNTDGKLKYGYTPVAGAKTISQSSARGIANGTTLSTKTINSSDHIGERNYGGMWIGTGAYSSAGSPSNVMAQEIYSIRIYNRILTADEVKYNQWVDDQRYSMGLNLTKPAE